MYLRVYALSHPSHATAAGPGHDSYCLCYVELSPSSKWGPRGSAARSAGRGIPALPMGKLGAHYLSHLVCLSSTNGL